MLQNNIPVKRNEFYDIEITSFGSEGQGVGKINGFTVFVPKAIPGEKIKVKILKVKTSYAFGKMIEILKESEQRVKPFCDVYGRCGGCMLQHMSYPKQLEYKKEKVEDALRKIGGFKDLVVNNVIGMENNIRYRNKAQYPVIQEFNSEVRIGFYAQRSHHVVENKVCYLQKEETDDIINIIKQWIKKNKISGYDEKNRRGILRNVYLRIVSIHEIMVVLVTNGMKLPFKDELINMLIDSNKNVVSIFQNINDKKTNVILGEENILLWGEEYLVEEICGLKYKLSPHSFLQVNTVQTEVLYNKVAEFADLNKNETVFDLYSGIGTISLYISKSAKKIIGVEIIEQAVKDAKENKKINNIENVEFYLGQVEKVVPRLYKEGIKADVVIVDPPRKGCDKILLDTILNIKPEKIIYVSCNPATLARDLSILTSNEYIVENVQPVDMFPHTMHVECVSYIKKVK